MKLRTVSVALCAALALAGAAWAVEGNPISGVGVSIKQSQGGLPVTQGTTNDTGNWVWQRPAAGAYVISFSGATLVAACARASVVTATVTSPSGQLAVQALDCATFTATGRRQIWQDVPLSLAPFTLNARQAGQPITIGVGTTTPVRR